MNIQVAGKLPNSLVNGPGLRYVLFTSGCVHHCEKCQNPQTWDFNYGDSVSVQDIFNDIKKNIPLINGLTLSGGDPMEQAVPLTELCKLVKEKLKLNIWCYTGYVYEELILSRAKTELLKYVDFLVDGLYIDGLKEGALKYTGSRNQRIIDLQDFVGLS